MSRTGIFFDRNQNDRYGSSQAAARLVLGSLVLVLFCNVRYTPAAELEPVRLLDPQRWQAGVNLSFDNDAFSGQDDHYTNGFQLYLVSTGLGDHRDGPLGALGGLLQALPGQGRTDRVRFQSLSLAQRIFTPEDIASREPVAGDMPYSGSLLLGLSATAQDSDHLDAWSAQLGVIGPAALAEEVQNGVHGLLGSDEARGWDHQLPNEPVLTLAYEHRWRWWSRRSGPWGADSLLTGGLMAGNLISQAHAGIGLRFGYQLPDDFALPPPFLGEEAIGTRARSEGAERCCSTWFYATVDLAGIAHAAFWDGTLLRDSPSIDRDPLMARLHLGLRSEIGRLTVDLGYVLQTVPWDNPGGHDLDSYGRLGLAWSL